MMSAFVENLARTFETVLADLPGSGNALRDYRQSALEAFARSGLPTARNEDWKYTSLRQLERRQFALAPGDADGDPGRLELPGVGACRVVFVDGRLSETLSSLAGLPDGVTCESLARALETGHAGLEALLKQEFAGAGQAFAQLNNAFMQGGVFLSVAAGAEMNEPLHIVYAGTASDVSRMSHLRNLIRLEDNARAVVVEHWLGETGHGNLSNVVGFSSLGRGAVFRHVRVQADSEKALVMDRHQVNQQADSQYSGQTFDFGGQLVRHDFNFRLEEAGARCELDGLYLLDGRSHVDNHTRIDHVAERCTSREQFRGVLAGRSRGVFNGKVVVHPGADGSDADQSNANLLLSEQAEVDTKPELEIYADEVRCSHGATVGQLDEDALFYLRSRGIDEHTAKALLVRGFCLDTVRRVAHAPLHEVLERLLDERLEKLPGGAGS